MINLERFKCIELGMSCDGLYFYCIICNKEVKESGTESLYILILELSQHIDSHKEVAKMHRFESKKDNPDICRFELSLLDESHGEEDTINIRYVNPFPGQTLRKVDQWSNMYEEYREEVVPGDIEKAQIVCSDMWVLSDYESKTLDGKVYKPHFVAHDRHKPILDIDFNAKLLPSTTEGHYHLFLDKEMSWELYEELLTTLAKCGIIEQGYANASIQRHYSAARLPWVKKEKHLNPNHPEEESPF